MLLRIMSLIIQEATYLQTPSLCGLRMLNLEANLSLKDILFNPYRFRRAVETASVMRGLLMISSHHNLLVHDQSKLYYSDKDPHYTSFSSEYYIYTLRRIVI